jgi:molybdopterin synthase sulfur carrier subunit
MHVEKSYRGISLRLAVHYLTESLGGERVDDGPEDIEEADAAAVEGDGWRAELESAKVDVAGSVRLTEISIDFEGDEEAVDPLVDRFSQKAMRAGG